MFHVVLIELIKHTLQFLIKAVLCVITFSLSWSMHIQNNNNNITNGLLEFYFTSYH
jgi:hypothetical protein